MLSLTLEDPRRDAAGVWDAVYVRLRSNLPRKIGLWSRRQRSGF